MIKTHDVEVCLFQLLNKHKDELSITGSIYIFKGRPKNSQKEDIIVNCLSLTKDLPQVGVVNINVYVPDKKVQIKGEAQLMPNFTRLNELQEKIEKIILEEVLDGVEINVKSDDIITEFATKERYLNIRLDLNIYNKVLWQ